MTRILILFVVIRFATNALPELAGQGLEPLIEEHFNNAWYWIHKLWQ